ncbi:MAG: hypothetical protein GIW99_05575 [Candidatus Eremiobacteraeota bacterium]|nr:hypothetical protein [Candidatus Eremiobacteraeota bacterium]
MSRLLVAFAVMLSLLAGGAAMAAQPTPVPDTAPDFSSMNFLIGTWHCNQALAGRAGRKETDTYTMAYDGWQMQQHTVSPPFDKYRSRADVGDTFITWDPTIKLWVRQTVDNFGGYGLETSPGWAGDTMTWSGTNPDGTVNRTVITKVSDTKQTYKTFVNSKKGEPQTLGRSGTCTKS